MNICYVLPEFVTEKEAGGLAKYYDNISRLMADSGNNVVIFVLSEVNEKVNFYEKITVYRVHINTDTIDASIPGSFMRHWSREINKAVKLYIREGNKIDIIQYPNFMALGFDRIEDIPVVMRVSSFRPYLRAADQEKFNPEKEYRSIKIPDFLEEMSVIKADTVYSPSRDTALIIQEETGKDISIIESPFYPKKINDTIEVYDVVKSKKFIITFGSLKALKGAIVIGDSIFDVLEKHTDIYWVFAGAELSWVDSEGKKIKPSDYIRDKAGIYSDRLIFLDKIPHDALLKIVSMAEACILPSRIDNLPNTCIEAMALGKVVVGTIGASFNQLIIDGVSGFLIERENCEAIIASVDKVLSLNDEQREVIGDNAKKRIAEMNPELIKKELLEMYKKTIKQFTNKSSTESEQYNYFKDRYNQIIRESKSELGCEYIL